MSHLSQLLPLFYVAALLAVFLGGQIGGRLGTGKISKLTLQRVAAMLILSVSGRLVWGLI